MTVTRAEEAVADLHRELTVNQAKLAGLSATYQLCLGGEDGGDEGGDWHIIVKDGWPELRSGRTDAAQVTIAMSAADFVAMHVGSLDPTAAFATGRLRVSGDRTLGMRLGSVLGRSAGDSAVTPELVIRLATGFMAAKHLFIANELGVFEQLSDGARSLEELAIGCAVPPRTLRIVADAMVGLGILERRDGCYANGPVAATFLTGRSPVDLRPHLRFWNRISYRRWLDLENAVRNDRAGDLDLDADGRRLAAEGIEAVTLRVALALSGGYAFERHRRVLDAGGGTGSFLVAALRHRPKLLGTLLETPQVAALARRRIAEAGLAGRIEVVEADFLHDPMPADHDLVILANVLHIFRADQNQALLARVRSAVATGTTLLLVDTWTGEDRSEPLQAALLAGEYLLANAGDVYSVTDVRRWLEATGWRLQEQRPLVGPASLLLAQADS